MKDFTIKDYKEVVGFLRKLASGGPATEHGALFGICPTLDKRFGSEVAESVMKYSVTWKEYSGCSVYPIPPRGGHGSPMNAYTWTSRQWDGEYGELRKDLCSHLADCLEKDYEAALFREQYPEHEQIVKRLRELGAGVASPVNVMYGICDDLHEVFGCKEIVSLFQKEWPLYSGDETFPVPAPPTYAPPTYSARFMGKPRIVYLFSANLWSGEYGDTRRAFCIFLADKVEEAARGVVL